MRGKAMRPTAADIRTASNRILASDPELARELSEIIKKRRPGWLRGSASAMNRLAGGYEGPRAAALEEAAPSFELETIVQRIGRPVLAITHGDTILAFRDAESAVWRTRLQEAAPRLHPLIGAIGRVEVSNFPMALPYVGTGWLVDSEVIVTNRHVALEFGDRGSKGFSFKLGFDRTSPIGADIDFLEEVGNEVRAQFTLSEILFIADDTGPDVAFLRVTRKQGDGLAVPVKLAQTLIPSQSLVATIGYPARGPRIPDQHLMEQVFGSVFDKKRLAPGFVTGIEGGALTHDCTTLGGNSGS